MIFQYMIRGNLQELENYDSLATFMWVSCCANYDIIVIVKGKGGGGGGGGGGWIRVHVTFL